MMRGLVDVWPTHPVVLTGDVFSVGIAFGSLYGALPTIAAVMSILWVGIQILVLFAKAVMWLTGRGKNKR
jgi:hypothetical protein